MNRQLAKQYFERAEALREAGNPEEAMALLNQLDDAFPNTKNIGVARARTYAAMGKIPEAVHLCDTLIDAHDSRRARELKEELLKGVLEPNAEDGPAPAGAPKSRAMLKWALAAGLIGVIAWSAQRLLAEADRLEDRRNRANASSVADSDQRVNPGTSGIRGEDAAVRRGFTLPDPEPIPGQVHPKDQWELDSQGLPVWKAGVFRRVPCLTEPERTLDIYIPLAYDAKPDGLFPAAVIQMPRKNPGFIGLEHWAERQEAILITINSSYNAKFSENSIAQDRALETIDASSLRVDQRLGFAVGMSGGGRASWQLACRYPENFVGIVMMAISGDEDIYMPPLHVRIAIIHGTEDFNNKAIARALKYLKGQGYDVREQIFQGGHEVGPLEIRTAMLDWMVTASRRDLGLPQPTGARDGARR